MRARVPTAVSNCWSPSSAPQRPKEPFAGRGTPWDMEQWDTGCPRITMAVAGSHVDLCVCRVKVPNVAAVQCLRYARPAEHRRAAEFDQHQRLDRGLLLGKVRFLIRKAGDVARRVALGDRIDKLPRASRSNALPCLAQGHQPGLGGTARRVAALS